MAPATPHEWTVALAGDVATRVVHEPAAEPLTGAAGEALVVVAHGAGSHMDHRATVELAAALRAEGLGTLRFDLPYRAAGRGRPDPMPRLMEGYRAVLASARREVAPARLVLGGRSLGGRTASMLAAEGEACDGLVLFAYPLHPPGKPERLRDAHLADVRVPALLVSGTRDTFCTPELMDALVERLPATWALHWLEGADHGYHVLKRSGRTDAEVLAEAARAASAWVEAELLGA